MVLAHEVGPCLPAFRGQHHVPNAPVSGYRPTLRETQALQTVHYPCCVRGVAFPVFCEWAHRPADLLIEGGKGTRVVGRHRAHRDLAIRAQCIRVGRHDGATATGKMTSWTRGFVGMTPRATSAEAAEVVEPKQALTRPLGWRAASAGSSRTWRRCGLGMRTAGWLSPCAEAWSWRWDC